jgi:PAS domain S-box-containing protein
MAPLEPGEALLIQERLRESASLQRHLAEGIYALSLARTKGEVHQVLMGRSAAILPGPHWFLGRQEADQGLRMVRLDGWHGSQNPPLGAPIEGLGIPIQDTGFAREIYDQRHLCFVPQVAAAPELIHPSLAKAYGLQGLLGVPLVFEGRITGSLYAVTFQGQAPLAPTEAQFAMLQSLARIAALALERMTAEANLEASATMARDLAMAVKELAGATSEDALMDLLFQWAGRLAPLPEWWYNRYDPEDRSSITTHWTRGLEALGERATIQRPMGVVGNRLLERLHFEQESILIDHCDGHPDLTDQGDWPYRTLVLLPLAHEDRVVGFLAGGSFGNQGQIPLSNDRYETLRSLAEVAGLVLGRLHARQALEAEERRFRMLFTQSPDPILLLRDGLITDTNEAALALFGASREALLGRSPLSLSPEIQPDGTPSAEVCEGHLNHAMEGHHERFEWTFLGAGGKPLVCLVDLTRLESGDGPVLHAIVRDISARKQAEAERVTMERQLYQAQKMESLGVLAGGIAHDFNNLLMGVLGNAGLALDQISSFHPARHNLLSIQKAGQRAADLTRQMLAYSGRGQFLVQLLDLSVQVEEMVHLLEVSLPKSVLLSLDLRRHLPPLSADPSQVQQVVMNLVINAAEAIGEASGSITIATGAERLDTEALKAMHIGAEAKAGTFLFLEVADTGCGMNPETLERIFEPFYTTKFTGRGLGLSALMGIVRGHGGALAVHSTPGRGTTFKVFFPAQPQELATPAATPADATRKGAGLILIVDDDETVRAVARQALERGGYEVIEARDGRFAVDQVRAQGSSVALVLLDMTMPHMGGQEAFKEMRQVLPDLRVILSSGYSEAEALGRFEGQGLKGFIQKPYAPKDLLAQVQSVLES